MTTITRRDAVTIFLDFIGRYDWRVHLDADGTVLTTIGDDPPGITQGQILYTLGALDDELRALLREGVSVH